MQNQHKRDGFVKILGLVILIIFIGGGIFMLSSDKFEKESPKISIKEEAVWNLKDYFPIQITDNSGIYNYTISLLLDQEKIPLQTQILSSKDSQCLNDGAELTPSQEIQESPKSLCIGIQKPKNIKNSTKEITLEIQATDTSKWNFFAGNTTTQTIHIPIDTKKPQLAILSHSYKITQGGSALVVFRAIDDNLKQIRISNGKSDFFPQPFYKEGFYISLIAWDKNNSDFNAKIYVSDKAGNVSITPINFYLQKKQYRSSTIPLTDSFIDGKISTLVQEIGEKDLEDFPDKLSIFKYINEDVRKSNAAKVYEIASNYDRETLVENFSIQPFSPLKNGAVMASFGDHRTFNYQGQNVSESNHMGLDLASTKQAPILLSNPGVVTLSEFVGINGNTLIIYHGLGLSTLYAHLTSQNVNVGDTLNAGEVIAKTGNTGLALGDHLHFSVLVQGHEVWTAEWLDSHWIKANITDIINEAKLIINQL